ncbi:alternate-type signal peptide domain-containing protein [Microbacterium abyssi]|uniref:alternate-type signal peptide domain-containing protein n=1 Tax=Microbacterium abyssi TaxID=2782166 RepID=UPI001886C7C7|nr:alternate-type signal peptide domain-containing protein [Microbacterium sp. A18JL241]
MKNLTKATIAGALGVVMLAGGTTFALWSDSAGLGSSAVNSGTLALTETGTGAWTDLSDDSAITDISAFRIVPGDTIEYTAEFTVAASGKNLTATLDVSDPVAATGDAELLANTTVTQTFTDAAGEPVVDGDITSANNGDVIDVTVTVAFAEATGGTTAQGQALDLSALTVTLTQTTTTP